MATEIVPRPEGYITLLIARHSYELDRSTSTADRRKNSTSSSTPTPCPFDCLTPAYISVPRRRWQSDVVAQVAHKLCPQLGWWMDSVGQCFPRDVDTEVQIPEPEESLTDASSAAQTRAVFEVALSVTLRSTNSKYLHDILVGWVFFGVWNGWGLISW